MEIITYKQVKLSNSNILTVEIEESFMNNYSIIAFDEFSDYEGGIWIEKFADTYEDATKTADKLILDIIKNY